MTTRFKVIILLSLLAIAAIVLYFFVFPKVPATPDAPSTAAPVVPPPPPNSPGLQEVIAASLIGSHGTYAIVVKNLRTGEFYRQNADRPFVSASLYKLWLMGTVFSQINQGKLTADTTLSSTTSELDRYFNLDLPFADEPQGDISLTVDQALMQTIVISANYPALLLTKQVGIPAMTAFLKENRFTQSRLAQNDQEPETSATDVANFLEKTYKGELISPESSAKMLDLLRWQRLNSKIPKYLPDDITIAHKTGEIDNFSHDAGIVFAPNGDYILVILSESDDPEAANERISAISKTVYGYFKQSTSEPEEK